MTKAKMIERIQHAESRAWLALAVYDNAHAPVVGGYAAQIDFDRTDAQHLKLLHYWYALNSLMEELGIESALDDEMHEKAFDLNHDLFIRRQAAQGIFYDENGNEITFPAM